MIQLRGVQMSFGTRVLYRGVELSIGERDRIGLVGSNGSGKTTLLKLISGAIRPETGRVERRRGLKVAFLPQTRVVLKNRTVMEEALSVFKYLSRISEEMRKLESAMEKGGDLNSLLKRYAVLQSSYEKDAFTCESRTKKVLASLGFSEEDLSRGTLEQSGGFQMRIALAKLLLQDPDVMLLDEPTNYLDIKSMEAFEGYLRQFKGSFVLIAHDRWLLEQCVERIWSIENQTVIGIKGNYSTFMSESQKRKDRLEKRHREEQKAIDEAKRFVDRFRAKAATARRARSKKKMIKRLDRTELPGGARHIRFRFKEADRIYGKVIGLKGIWKRYRDKLVLQDVSLIVGSSECAAIFGANGEGKTTLLEIIAGRLKASSGQIWRSAKLRIGFYSQGAEEELDDARTVFEEASASAEGYTVQELRDILGRFLFSADDIHKRVAVLSGGERTRLAILRVLLTPSNLLILDEPANHLDIQSREVLEDAIRSYQQTVLFAAHDRFMIDRLATKTVKVEDGKLSVYPGNYSYAARSREGLSEPTLMQQPSPEREEVDLLRLKRDKLREVEEDYENAKANLQFEKARELWQEYEIVRREIDRLLGRKLLLQEDEDGI